MDVSRRIRQIRTDKQISQTAFAEMIGVERSTYHKMEKRAEKLSLEQLEAIAKALKVNVKELLFSQEELSNIPGSKDSMRLERRIQELEDRIRDKETINDSLARGKAAAMYHFILRIIGYAEDMKLGEQVKVDESISSVPTPTADGGLLAPPFKLSANDIFQIAMQMHSWDRNYFSLIATLIEHNIIDSKVPFVDTFYLLSQKFEVSNRYAVNINDILALVDEDTKKLLREKFTPSSYGREGEDEPRQNNN